MEDDDTMLKQMVLEEEAALADVLANDLSQLNTSCLSLCPCCEKVVQEDVLCACGDTEWCPECGEQCSQRAECHCQLCPDCDEHRDNCECNWNEEEGEYDE